MNFTTRKLPIAVGALLCVLFQVGWGAENADGDLILQEYDRLLELANDGDASDKVALFLYTAKHSAELEKHAETALGRLVEASNDGYGEASFWIGYLSDNGIWMDQSDQGAMIYYVLSAQQGNDKGMHASLLHFAKAAVAATSEDERESALTNAQKWYDALVEIRDNSESVFKSARFNYAAARLKIDPLDELGMELFSQAAIDGNESAAGTIRRLYAQASSSDWEGNDGAARTIEIWKRTIEKIGATDKQTQ